MAELVSTTPSAGDVLPGGFQLKEPLGEGASSFVWLAEQPATGHRYALKIARSDEHLALLRRQARTPRHERIVAIHSIQEADRPGYLVMEYVRGRDLRTMLREGKKHEGFALPPALALLLLRDIGEALSAAHVAGVVHGDLKPENILVDGDGRAKVTDFGAVKTIGDASMKHSLTTMAGPVPFTPVYIAPEVRSGEAETTPASDFYALGVILHEMLTGDLPHGMDTIRDVRKSAPPWADRLFKRLYTSVERRIGSGEELFRELDRVAEGAPVVEAVVSPVQAAPEAISSYEKLLSERAQARPIWAPPAQAALARPIYAGFWIRVAAAIFDTLVLSVAYVCLAATFREMAAPPFMLLGWLYRAVLESSAGQGTLGKQIFGLKVTDLGGRRISFLHASGRWLSKFVSAICLCAGYVAVGFTEKKQGFHDLIAGTLVVRK